MATRRRQRNLEKTHDSFRLKPSNLWPTKAGTERSENSRGRLVGRTAGSGTFLRRSPERKELIPADLVFLALGFLGPEPVIAEQFGLEIGPRIQHPGQYEQTTKPASLEFSRLAIVVAVKVSSSGRFAKVARPPKSATTS